MSARARHERIERWSPCVIALYLDRGVITEWPFELTRHGKWVVQRDLADRDETETSDRS